MIVLNDIVHKLAGVALTFLGQYFVSLQVTDGAKINRVLVDVDHPWSGDLRPAESFPEKTLGCSSAPGLIQEEIECLAGRVNGSIQVHPLASDLDVGLINFP